MSQAHKGGLHHRVRTALVEEAGYLREVRVRVRVGGAATDDEDGGLFPFILGDDGGDPPVHQLEELGTDAQGTAVVEVDLGVDRKSTRLNSSHANISYAVFCLKKKKR